MTLSDANSHLDKAIAELESLKLDNVNDPPRLDRLYDAVRDLASAVSVLTVHLQQREVEEKPGDGVLIQEAHDAYASLLKALNSGVTMQGQYDSDIGRPADLHASAMGLHISVSVLAQLLVEAGVLNYLDYTRARQDKLAHVVAQIQANLGQHFQGTVTLT